MYQSLINSIQTLSVADKNAITTTYQTLAEGRLPLFAQTPLYQEANPTLCYLAQQNGVITQCFGCHVVQKTPHQVTWQNGSLYAWCIWDALFIVQSVGLPACIDTVDAINKTPISIIYADKEFSTDGLARIRFTFPLAISEQADDLLDLRSCFCCRTHAFVDEQTATEFANKHHCEVIGWQAMLKRADKMVAALFANLAVA